LVFISLLLFSSSLPAVQSSSFERFHARINVLARLAPETWKTLNSARKNLSSNGLLLKIDKVTLKAPNP